jgi:hypothetical protein
MLKTLWNGPIPHPRSPTNYVFILSQVLLNQGRTEGLTQKAEEKTNSMEQKPYSEANSRSPSQDIPGLLWKTNIFVFTSARPWTLF